MLKDTTELKVDDLQARELTADELGGISGGFGIQMFQTQTDPVAAKNHHRDQLYRSGALIGPLGHGGAYSS